MNAAKLSARKLNAWHNGLQPAAGMCSYFSTEELQVLSLSALQRGRQSQTEPKPWGLRDKMTDYNIT